MAVIVLTKDPSGLLKALKAAMNAKTIDTWSVDTDGDFTHTPPQWATEAWLRPSVKADRIVFTILNPRGKKVSTTVYGVYHGRFIEMLLNYFDSKFSLAYATALPDYGDVVGS